MYMCTCIWCYSSFRSYTWAHTSKEHHFQLNFTSTVTFLILNTTKFRVLYMYFLEKFSRIVYWTQTPYKCLVSMRTRVTVLYSHSVCASVCPPFVSSSIKRLYDILNMENRLYAKFKRFLTHRFLWARRFLSRVTSFVITHGCHFVRD